MATFKPYRGLDANILASDPQDGNLYVAIDSGMVYVDVDDKHVPVGGGNGVSLYYSFAPANIEPDESGRYTITEDYFEEDQNISRIKPDDILVNVTSTDSCFYRVEEITSDKEYICVRIAVSGGGTGGGGGLAKGMSFQLIDVESYNLINKQEAKLHFKLKSGIDSDGNILDNEKTLSVSWKAYTVGATTPYDSGVIEEIYHDTVTEFEYGSKLTNDATSYLVLEASAPNTSPVTKTIKTGNMTTSKLELSPSSKFSFATSCYSSNPLVMYCDVLGNIPKILDFYIDGELVSTQPLAAAASGEQSARVSNLGPGVHTARMELSQNIGTEAKPKYGNKVPAVEFQFGYSLGLQETIVWLGNYQSLYYNYDTVQIPFVVYNPNNSKSTVAFYKGNVDLDAARIVDNNDLQYFEISDTEINKTNLYFLRVLDTEISIPIQFKVEQDPVRKMELVYPENMLINFSAVGRSNNQSETRRQTWNYESEVQYKEEGSNDFKNYSFTGSFKDFNWNNNGWKADKDKNTLLRISNGAEFKIDLGNMSINSSSDSSKASAAFEFQFKVKNIQDYSNLVKEFTRYKGDKELWTLFRGQSEIAYDNYDQFLQWFLAESTGYIEVPVSETIFLSTLDASDASTEAKNIYYIKNEEEFIPVAANAVYDPERKYYAKANTKSYDDITEAFDKVEKQISLNATFCRYYNTANKVGLCLGPQDGFFTNGSNTVSVKYVEDEMTNLTIVSNFNDKRIYIYLNGVLTGVTTITNTKLTTIEPDGGCIAFNSEYCDLDLYKFRVYNTVLDTKNVCINYAVDHKDVDAYDHANLLLLENKDIGEYQFDFAQMVDYNKKNPDKYLMPYVIFQTNTSDKLPYSKANKKTIAMEFVNTGLDRAYQTGDLLNSALQEGYHYYIDSDKKIHITLKEDTSKNTQKLARSSPAEVLEEAIKYYYIYHCPSWRSNGFNVELAVQGTSSEFYPRRNYKAKTKDGKKNVNMYMNRGPFATQKTNEVIHKPDTLDDESTQLDFFYFNNYSVGSTKFTMKIDYMESSGTYNVGMANLSDTAYTKHPLDDYNDKNAFEKEKEYVYTTYTDATYPGGNKDYVEMYKQNADSKWEAFKVSSDGRTIGEGEDAVETVAYAANTYSSRAMTYTDGVKVGNTKDLRTAVTGFPVLAFWLDENGHYTFIGRYNMLSDKGSDEMYGFKPSSSILNHFTTNLSNKAKKHTKVSKTAECWEFSNNNRGFCSFRDPMGRKELSFKVYKLADEDEFANGRPYFTDPYGEEPIELSAETYEKNKYYTVSLNSVANSNCPIVADSFEYRYHEDADIMDYIYDPKTNASKKDGLDEDVKTEIGSWEYNSKLIFNDYANWEKACKWVWSTCTDATISGYGEIPSLGTYSQINLCEAIYEADKYFIYDINANDGQGGYLKAEDETFYPEVTYFTTTGDDETPYRTIPLTDDENMVYVANTYYTKIGNNYVLCEGDAFNSDFTYYSLSTADNIDSKWELSEPVTYGSKTYKYDTKEYRLAKFKYELAEHFDLEYCLVYFVMTEVFLLYDSRGKNCMMASWGPQKEGGDYIWYPIFYDMDTQLGINNTGIPSFDYSVNATVDGCFSTSDSVLWNNLYTCFFTDIQGRYHILKTNVAREGISHTGPINSVKHIESYYLTDPNTYKNYVMKGSRPIAALNMDEQYKYISICNPKVQYQLRDGTMGNDGGTFFYALQGDRSLSRQQFLARRINFIDSWLSEGDYSRSDGTDIHGRISANKPGVNSDAWIEGTSNGGLDNINMNVNYYQTDEHGQVILNAKGYPQKTQYLDADIFVELTPYQKSYVTIGDDNEAFGSKEYQDAPVRFEFPTTLANGIRTSGNYAEQLLYIYGASSLKDMGDVSRLYWTEFYAKKSPHLSRILLGNDDTSFYNTNLKMPDFDADAGSADGKPLLKEVNLDNLHINNGDSTVTFDFTTSEKLEIFKAIRTNTANPEVTVGACVKTVDFAPGVALHTLYLPSSISQIDLVKAKNLTNLIKEQSDIISRNEYNAATDTWTSPRGLYIQNLFDNNCAGTSSDIQYLSLEDCALGTYSYEILKRLYDIKQTNSDMRVSLTKVEWSPYIKLDDGYVYKSTEQYYIDDGHYGFKQVVPNLAALTDADNQVVYNSTDWETQIANGELYRYNASAAHLDDDAYTLLSNIARWSNWKNTDEINNAIPEITGDIYIDNTVEIDEGDIRNIFLQWYPDVNVHFAKVKKAYSAKFIILDTDGKYITVGTQKISQDKIGTTWFNSPYTEYPDTPYMKLNYDFQGWSKSSAAGEIITDWSTSKEQVFNANQLEYLFYAIYSLHFYNIVFQNKSGKEVFKYQAAAGTMLRDPYLSGEVLPAADITTKDGTEEKIPLNQRYKFIGWVDDPQHCYPESEIEGKKYLKDLTIIPSQNDDKYFYAAYTLENVYDTLTNEDLFVWTSYNYRLGSYANAEEPLVGLEVSPKQGVRINGKITLASTHKVDDRELPVLSISGFANQTGLTHVFWKGDANLRTTRNTTNMFQGGTFYSCTSLEYFETPSTFEVYQMATFRNVKNLESITLAPSTLEVRETAFYQSCKDGITPILTIPASVKVIESQGIGYLNTNSYFAEIKFESGSQCTTLNENAFLHNSGRYPRKYTWTDHSLDSLIRGLKIDPNGPKPEYNHVD